MLIWLPAGVAADLVDPTWQAVLPEVVPSGLLTSTAMLASVSYNSSRIIGPALGGALVSLGGPELAFALNGLLFLVAGLAVIVRFPRAGASSTDERVRTGVATGLRYIVFSPVVRRVILRIVLWGRAASIMYALMPVIAVTISASARDSSGCSSAAPAQAPSCALVFWRACAAHSAPTPSSD